MFLGGGGVILVFYFIIFVISFSCLRWDAVLQKRLAWALLFCNQPSCVVSQQSWFGLVCFINFPILPPPLPSLYHNTATPDLRTRMPLYSTNHTMGESVRGGGTIGYRYISRVYRGFIECSSRIYQGFIKMFGPDLISSPSIIFSGGFYDPHAWTSRQASYPWVRGV